MRPGTGKADMTDPERFHEFSRHISGYGIAVEEHTLDEKEREPLHHIRLMAESHWPRSYFAGELGFDYYCGYFISEDANALAMKREKVHWIGLTTPMIHAATELAIRAAGQIDLPAGIDEGSRPVLSVGETMVFQPGPDAFKLDIDKVENQCRFYRQVREWPYIRQRMANVFFSELLLFVMRHELFHAALGHCSFLEGSFGIREVAEKPSKAARIRKELCAMQQALELHADWAAYGSVIRMMRSGHDFIGNDVGREYGEVFRFGLTTISASLLPIVLAFAEKTQGELPRTHPSAAARFLTFASRIKELESERALYQNWRAGAQWAFEVLAALGKRHHGFDAFLWLGHSERQQRAHEERLELIDRLKDLQMSLIPFAVLPLGDPHQGSLEPYA